MFKKYLLATADDAASKGFIIGLFPLLIPGFILLLVAGVALLLSTPEMTQLSLGLSKGGVSLGCASIPMGIVLAIITSCYRQKYIAHVDDYSDSSRFLWKTLLKVKDGRVVDFGTFVWGKDGVHLVGLPRVYDGEFSTSTCIERQVGKVKVSVNVTLSAYVPDIKATKEALKYGFMPQEIYGVVVLGGYASVNDWLAGTFKNLAELNWAVQQVLEKYSYRQPYELTEAVQQALQDLSFTRELSNISRIEATVSVDSGSFVAMATY